MRFAVLAVALAACGSPAATPDAATTGSADAPVSIDAPTGVPLAGFGDITGMCGVLGATQLTEATSELFRDTIMFQRAYKDPDDRPLLTTGGQHLAMTPNAGGSSGLSEIFAYEELARCELATFLKSETEIIYTTTGKITDLEVMIGGHKIGVSVTRAVAYPFGSTYTMDVATALATKKLDDIQASTANVSAGDKWDKQILAVLAWDDAAADTFAAAVQALDATVRANTLVVITTTAGDDTFIYTNM